MKKLRADYIQGMLATIQFIFLCLSIFTLWTWKLKYTKQ